MGATLKVNALDMSNGQTTAANGLTVNAEDLSVSGVGMPNVSSLSISTSIMYGAGNRLSLTIEPNNTNTYIRFTPTVAYAYTVFYQYGSTIGGSSNTNVAANTAVNKGYPITRMAGKQENYKVKISGGAVNVNSFGLTAGLCIEYWFNHNLTPVYMREIITQSAYSSSGNTISTINLTMSTGNFWYIKGQYSNTGVA